MAARAEDVANAFDLNATYHCTRSLSVAIAAPLSDADATVQPHPDASPAKWHLAHTTWFFETFVLRDHIAGHRPYDERFAYLFNSYYEAEGARHARDRRGMLARPRLDEILQWRAAIDEQMDRALPDLPPAARDLVTLGINHEQQHQELMLTDLLATFAANPLDPTLWDRPRNQPAPIDGFGWTEGRAGIVEIGHDGDGFAFDCEGPRHTELLHPHALADRPVTNSEWRDFIADGGYSRPELWLADGWAWVKRESIEAPLYWRHDEEGGWLGFALDGLHPLHPAAPVTHISHYEADAYARWAGARLPTEAEWEAAVGQVDLTDAFGEAWQWTASPYVGYPGFVPAVSAVGEYNGKFMVNQYVLRGSCLATPDGHARLTYRNFFPPHARWMFSGIRLARGAAPRD